jgi:Kef-type K+ transport system membrane component KefB
MVIVSTAVADDTVGWILLAVITGLVERHRLDVATVATALLGTAAFLLFAFTVGQWLVNRTLRAAESFSMPFAKTTAVLVIVFVGGAMTQAIHVHLVLGSFVAGILVFRSPARERGSVEPLRTVGMSFFVPLFFAYTGIKVDLTTLRGSTLAVAVLAVGLACISKFLGSVVGARLGGLSKWEALAAGAGRNARGAMELVIAAIGLSIGVLSLPMYSIVVLIAVVTTLMAAPILRACVRRIPEDGTRVPGTEKEKGRVSA